MGVAPHARQRISCSFQAGIYYENNEDFEINVSGWDVSNQIRDLLRDCGESCKTSEAAGTYFSGIANFEKHRIIVTDTSVFNGRC